jgi:hypothetical protein
MRALGAECREPVAAASGGGDANVAMARETTADAAAEDAGAAEHPHAEMR